ncbi:Six-hairpin glycosidase [Thozetella sp. PMI_491]|nr:Six-hairpin glycosidase [Thozetella sp. PMI_491]
MKTFSFPVLCLSHWVWLSLLFSQTSTCEKSIDKYDKFQTTPISLVKLNDAIRKSFLPTGLAVGLDLSAEGGDFKSFQLSPSAPFATVDYGVEVAGYPFFEVERVQGQVQIEVKYAEEFLALKANFSDGPFPYAVALANTYRVETFEITKPGRIESALLQGGQRWQSIKILTGGSVTLTSVGYVPSIPLIDIDNLPGRFGSSDQNLNEIWKLGARSTVMACIEAGTQKTMWKVSEENGVYVQGMRAGTTPVGTLWRDYTLEFDTKIERGGVGWTVVSTPFLLLLLLLLLTRRLLRWYALVNTNTSLTQPNKIIFGYGSSFVNQTTLTSFYLDTFLVPFSVETDKWYHITTVLDGKHLAVSIGSITIFNVTISNYWISDVRHPSGVIDTQGSWGFGGWQDQAGYFKNVVVYNTANGTVLYGNPMTNAADDGVVREYGVQANSQSVCLDGAKRDRLVWLGDFLHTVRVIASSTSRFDWAKGTLQFLVDWQTPSGLMPYAPPIGYVPSLAKFAFGSGGGAWFKGDEVYGYILADYQVLGVLSFTEYVRLSNNLAFAKQTWPNWKANLDWIIGNVNSTTGLLDLRAAFLGRAASGSATNCALVETFRKMSDVATALGEGVDATRYSTLADTLALAINRSLWNETLGVYGQSLTDKGNFSVNSIAFCITSETANSEKATRLISALPRLKLSPGFMDTSSSSRSRDTIISPNTNGFLLESILSQGTKSAAIEARDLIKSLWTPMLYNKKTATGSSWEYVDQNGNPGLGLFTSLSHPWGGAPTYILIKWVTGIQTEKGPKGYGYGNWVVAPQMGIYVGLKETSSKVVTAFGGDLEVSWKIVGEFLAVSIKAPPSTTGTFKLGNQVKTLSGKRLYDFVVKICHKRNMA